MLSYRLFQLRLAIYLFFLTFSNVLIPIKKRASFMAAEILTALVIGLLMTQLFNSGPAQISEPVSAAPPPVYYAQLEEEMLTPKEIETKISQLNKLLEIQPTHFDLLINLALLEQASGNDQIAAEHWDKAREINPNAEIFQND